MKLVIGEGYWTPKYPKSFIVSAPLHCDSLYCDSSMMHCPVSSVSCIQSAVCHKALMARARSRAIVLSRRVTRVESSQQRSPPWLTCDSFFGLSDRTVEAVDGDSQLVIAGT